MILTALSARRWFIVYRRSTKSPIDPLTLANSDGQNPAGWMLPGVAAGWAAALGPEYGIGIVIHAGCGLFAIDLDGCIDAQGQLSPVAAKLLSEYPGAYTEKSQSGTGMHIIASYVGEPPTHSTKNLELHLELYTQKRFIALTTGTGSPLADFTQQLWATAFGYFRKSEATTGDTAEWTTEDDPACTITGSDDERIAQLIKSKSVAQKFGGGKATFQDMWELNVDALSRSFPPSPSSKSDLPYDGSSVDQAFANHLAYGFARNAESIKRVMLSGVQLERAKWTERPDYLERTILNAVSMPARWPARKLSPVLVPVAEVTVTLSNGSPDVPDKMPEAAEPETLYIGGSLMPALFDNCVQVMDVHRIVGPDGFIMDRGQFDDSEQYARRIYAMTPDSSAPTKSAWEAFTQSQVYKSKQVRGMFFDPRETPGAILEREGLAYINTYYPAPIVSEPGDVTPFLTHLMILFQDWRLLLNYLKFMMQHKGVKAMWWPFLQGVPGNGKSFISNTMAYCIGEKFTQRPAASKLDGNFNAKLYGCLFLGVDDIKVADDYGKMWEALKPMITETRLEIEAKGIDKVTREVCFNAILNSNHKDGIRKDSDDRRIASFFAKQQRRADLERDGLTKAYFSKLWEWAQAGGWAHVAHYLANDPIDADFSHTECPVTSCTAEHIQASRSHAQQEIMASVASQAIGFRGGWLNMTLVQRLLDMRRYKVSHSVRIAMVEELGYAPAGNHPESGQVHLLYALAGTQGTYASVNQ